MIIGRLSGDTAVQLRLRAIPIAIRERLREAVRQSAIDLTAYVKGSKLSGQVLKNRTGRLRRSINFRLNDSPNGISATVGTNVEYAAIHEYGFDGMETVRAHVRRVNSRNVRAQLADAKNKTKVATGVAFVRAHDRHMHVPERSFLRSALAEKQAEIKQRLQSVTHGL